MSSCPVSNEQRLLRERLVHFSGKNSKARFVERGQEHGKHLPREGRNSDKQVAELIAYLHRSLWPVAGGCPLSL